MIKKSRRPIHINRQLAGAPIQVRERTLQPIARVTGWRGAFGKGAGTAWLHAVPVEVLVTDRNGQTYRVPIHVHRRVTVRWLAVAGALVVPINWLFRKALARRRLS